MSETVRNTRANDGETNEELPSEAVVSAVAAAEGVDETELSPLYDACDPDALNSIFSATPQRASTASSSVEFEYHGYTVRVQGDGAVELLE